MAKACWKIVLLAGVLASATAVAQTATTRPASGSRPATTQAEVTKFLRFVEEGTNARLEAAEITYVNQAGVQVRLVSAVHIGERSYYQSLMRRFAQDDAVLYEMVKPKNAPPPQPGARSNHPVSGFQRFLKNSLNLEFQLDLIDYTRPNFVHADLDYETFSSLQEQRGESMSSLMMQSMMDAMARGSGQNSAGGDSASQLLMIMSMPDPERQMKLLLARQFDDIEATASGLNGPNGSVILTERNKAAIEVLKQTLGNRKRRISVFYGAAHMPDLARRLEELGFAKVDTTWVIAWDVTVRPNRPSMLQRLLGPTTTPGPATQPGQ